jgi:colanic acid biosynthesis glycosyl transferase WcaI
MRILAIYRHYWPDATPYARILRGMLEHFVNEGHTATVFTCQPSYSDTQNTFQPTREVLNGVAIRRVKLMKEKKAHLIRRALNFLIFVLQGAAYAIQNRRQYDVVIANTHPPILMGCMLRLIHWSTGLPFIYHVQDIHPECIVATGELKQGWMAGMLRGFDSNSCSKAHTLVVLSEDMLSTLRERGMPTHHATVLNNPPQVADKLPAITSNILPRHSSRCCCLFAGNLGRFQGLDVLVKAMHSLGDETPVNLVFMGEGVAKSRLVAQSGNLLNRSIFFIPNQPVEVAQAAMRVADFGIVSLLPMMHRYAFPSKFTTYLLAGCPIVAIVEAESQLASTVRDLELGYVVEEMTPTSIAATLIHASKNKQEWTPERRNEVSRVCEIYYGETRIRQEWSRIIGEIDMSAARESERTERIAA